MNTGLVEIPNFKLNVRTQVPFQDLSIATKIITEDEYGLMNLFDYIPIPKVILDVGGHIGTFGIFAKSLWPDALLIAVEPSEDNAAMYQMNLDSNNMSDNSIIINAAVNYSDRKILINASRTTGGGVLLSEEEADEYIATNYRMCNGITNDNVKSITIEDIIRDYNLDAIDLAKFDCEGAEQDIFENMTDDSAAKFRYLVGEYHYWTAGMKILRRSPHGEFKYWKKMKKKFKHLNFYSSDPPKPFGAFSAWPKEIDG